MVGDGMKALHKDFWMEIRKSKARFISIFLIVALGVAFFSGIQASSPDMRYSGDAYYEAAHKGGYYTRFLYSSLAAKYININICHALKALDNSIYIVEGETEPNGKAVTNDYCASNPAIEVSVLKETKHLPHVEAPEAFLEQVKIFF